jgi:hypothetical protein
VIENGGREGGKVKAATCVWENSSGATRHYLLLLGGDDGRWEGKEARQSCAAFAATVGRRSKTCRLVSTASHRSEPGTHLHSPQSHVSHKRSPQRTDADGSKLSLL